MSIATLALIVAIGLLGPLLARPTALRIPVVVGELLAGIVFGRTGFHRIDAADPTLTFLSNVGFALIMFIAGSHVPIHDRRLKSAIRPGLGRALAAGALAVPLGYLVASAFHTGHGALYAVLIASSSAAFALPIIDALRLSGDRVLQLLPQLAFADAACIVVLPLVIEPKRAGRAALGALVLIVAAAIVYLLLSRPEAVSLRRRAHRTSRQRGYALELRFSLLLLLGFAALAQQLHVSIMLAGFSLGLVVSAIGEPKRLARQLFGLTEGFLGPLFFVWLGASLNLHDLVAHRSYILLGLCLGLAALVAHLALVVTHQPVALGALAAGQLGVPVAAATLGSQVHLLHAGEAAALLLGALVAIAAATIVLRIRPVTPEPATGQ